MDVKLLFDKYYARLCVYSFSMLHDKDVAEDVVQGVFYNILNSGDSSKDINLAYLYKGVKNSSLKVLRKDETHSTYLGKLSAEDFIHYDDKILKAELIATLTKALDTIPEGSRTVIQLSYLDGLKNEEIANLLGISINTVKSQKKRGLCLLRAKVDPQLLYLFIFLLKKI